MDKGRKQQISVSGGDQALPLAGLLRTLEAVYPVEFYVSATGADSSEMIRFSHVGEECSERNTNGSSLEVPGTIPGSEQQAAKLISVRFSDHPDAPFPFRGECLQTKVQVLPKPLTLGPTEEALVTTSEGPLWAYSTNGGVSRFRSAFPLPAVPENGTLVDFFNGNCFLEFLPLIRWIRELCWDVSNDKSPLWACYIFDDPNLHWPTYGYVDYRRLAARAERENYHVAFATIPLDGWFVHDGTSEIFRTNQRRLSLLVHGNNHTFRELGRNYSNSQASALLRQAQRRIDRLEQRSGVSIARVMVPPHGACVESVLTALPFWGFESACLSHGSLRAHNKQCEWSAFVGLRPAEFIHGSLVLPRWGLSGDLTNTILVAAFLGQPLIFRGHHQDLKDGPEPLDKWARLINGLGRTVAWTDLSSISRAYTESCLELVVRTERAAFHNEDRCESGWRWVPPFAVARRLATELRDRWKS